MLSFRPLTRSIVLISAVLALATAVLPAHADEGKYRFVVYGDTRSNPAKHKQVLDKVLMSHPEFILQTGDLVANGGNAGQWAEFDDITKPIRDAHIPYYPARGNHDLGHYYLNEVREKYDSGNGYYYAFTLHGSRFIAIDSMDPGGVDPNSVQYKWVAHELAAAHNSARHVFVMFHEGPFTVGPHGPDPQAVAYLVPLFTKYHVSAVLTGHDHLYYRTIRDGIHYFVTGGGGAPLYDPVNAPLAIPGDVYDKAYHYIVFDVDGSHITATAYDIDNKQIDKVSWVG